MDSADASSTEQPSKWVWLEMGVVIFDHLLGNHSGTVVK